MFAVDHAATALLIKRRYPTAPLAPILISVQAMELAWVGLNYLGVERTTTEAAVHSVADVHLAYMPYSHSVATAVGVAVLAWLIIEKGLGRAALGRAVGIGILSHLILDLRDTRPRHRALAWVVHAQAGPGFVRGRARCRVHRGVSLWNRVLVRLSRRARSTRAHRSRESRQFVVPIAGRFPALRRYLAGRPLLLVTVIFAQIVVTLVLVGVLARRGTPSAATRPSAAPIH